MFNCCSNVHFCMVGLQDCKARHVIIIVIKFTVHQLYKRIPMRDNSQQLKAVLKDHYWYIC